MEGRGGVPLPSVFPEPIAHLPQAELPFPGARAYLSQGTDHQLLFMEFNQDVVLPPHAHAAQWGIVLEGEIRLVIGGVEATYRKGDRYFIPEGVEHRGHIFAGYADITFFAQRDRYMVRWGAGCASDQERA